MQVVICTKCSFAVLFVDDLLICWVRTPATHLEHGSERRQDVHGQFDFVNTEDKSKYI